MSDNVCKSAVSSGQLDNKSPCIWNKDDMTITTRAVNQMRKDTKLFLFIQPPWYFGHLPSCTYSGHLLQLCKVSSMVSRPCGNMYSAWIHWVKILKNGSIKYWYNEIKKRTTRAVCIVKLLCLFTRYYYEIQILYNIESKFTQQEIWLKFTKNLYKFNSTRV